MLLSLARMCLGLKLIMQLAFVILVSSYFVDTTSLLSAVIEFVQNIHLITLFTQVTVLMDLVDI